MKKIINCKICEKELSGKQTMYCSTSCKNKAHQSYDSQKARGLKRKIDVVSNRKFSQITDELKKCELICHNCHAEIHHPQHDLASNL